MIEQEEKQEIIFPQNFDIKVIVGASVPIEESKANISQVFSTCKSVHSFVSTISPDIVTGSAGSMARQLASMSIAEQKNSSDII